MLIRRLTLTLPARLRATAHHDARAIAEALALELSRGAPQGSLALALPGNGLTGPILAAALAAQAPKGGRHGR